MKYLHTMVRVSDIDESLDFYCNKLGLVELRRKASEQGRFTLIFLAAPGDEDAQVELTYNWDPEEYGEGRNFGHLAYLVDDIYAVCQRLMDGGVTINRPPRDGHMAAGALGLDAELRALVSDRASRHYAAGGINGGSSSFSAVSACSVRTVIERSAFASASLSNSLRCGP